MIRASCAAVCVKGVCSPALHLRAVPQSATLLKNTLNTLPLSGATAGTIAVIGPNAQLSKSDAGYYGTFSQANVAVLL